MRCATTLVWKSAAACSIRASWQRSRRPLMPELPEVEPTRRGLLPYLQGQRVAAVIVRNRALRWPVPRDFARKGSGCTVRTIARRGKYLLIDCETGWIILHLGMSG